MKKSIKGIAFATAVLMCSSFGVSVSAADEVAINETNFPDEVFRSYVSESFDTDGSGGLSESEISKTIGLNLYNKNVATLKGIEYFTALKELDCASNKLTSLDVSQNTALTTLSCEGNQFNIGTITSPYSLTNLPEGFDASKASNWTGATYDSTTNTLTNFTSTTVTYDYDCGNNQTATFTLVADNIPEDEDEGNEENYIELDTFSVDEFTVKDKTEKDPITQQDFYTGRPDNFYIKNIHENTAGALFDDYEALRLDYTITGKDKPETILAVIYG